MRIRYAEVYQKRVLAINVIMHDPKSAALQRELTKKVAVVHAEAVIEKLKSVSCPPEQKAEIIDKIIQIHKNQNGA